MRRGFVKRKGSSYERELIEILWRNGLAAVRVAGSGCSSFPSPDVVAGNGRTLLALEVKMRRTLPLYLTREEVEQLKAFAEKFGAEPYVALKLPRKDWKFFTPEMLEETKKGFRISEETYRTGLELGEVLGRFLQTKLGVPAKDL